MLGTYVVDLWCQNGDWRTHVMALIMLPVAVQAVHPPGGMVTHQCWIVDYGLGATETARVHKTSGGTLKVGANRNQLGIRSAIGNDGIWPCG